MTAAQLDELRRLWRSVMAGAQDGASCMEENGAARHAAKLDADVEALSELIYSLEANPS